MTQLVAVNGLGGLAHMWEPFRSALRGAAALLVLDLPGHGDVPPAADYGYDALVQDVSLRTSDMEPFVLLGWSVGGAVAWLFAARHPGRVRRLVLLDPAAPHQSRFRHGPTPPPVHPYTYASPAEAAQALRAIDPTAAEDDVLLGHQQSADGRWEPRFDPAIYPALVEDARERGQDLYRELEKVRVPTLILRGERSFAEPGQVEEIASALPAARVATVPGAGHFMIRERPDTVARLVIDFLG